MSIEETRPNKPNFKLIVILAVVVMLALLVIVVLGLHWDGRHLMPRVSKQHVTSQLQFPQASGQIVGEGVSDYSASPM